MDEKGNWNQHALLSLHMQAAFSVAIDPCQWQQAGNSLICLSQHDFGVRSGLVSFMFQVE